MTVKGNVTGAFAFQVCCELLLTLVSEMRRVEIIKNHSSAKAVLTETEGESAIIGAVAEGTVSPAITLRPRKTIVQDCTKKVGTSMPGDLRQSFITNKSRRRASEFSSTGLEKKLTMSALRIISPDTSQPRFSGTSESQTIAINETSVGDSQHASRGANDPSREQTGHKAVSAQPVQAPPEQEGKNGVEKLTSAPEPAPVPADALATDDEPPDLEALLEERRRKRRELLERLAGTQSGVNSATPSSLDGSAGAQSTGTTGKNLLYVPHRPSLTPSYHAYFYLCS